MPHAEFLSQIDFSFGEHLSFARVRKKRRNADTREPTGVAKVGSCDSKSLRQRRHEIKTYMHSECDGKFPGNVVWC
jgi:hypothetical protein